MWPMVLVGAAAFVLGGRNRPKTTCKKVELMGKSGRFYVGEHFPELGLTIVRTSDAIAVFKQMPEGRVLENGKGNLAPLKEDLL